jgi:hypothetical protein
VSLRAWFPTEFIRNNCLHLFSKIEVKDEEKKYPFLGFELMDREKDEDRS